jgi:AcrR family transcriptional regulator
MPRVSAAHEQEVRERIVAAAVRVFGERGFHGATMQDVVRASGLSVGAIYTYFRSKDELFLAGCDATSGRTLGELAGRLAAGTTTAERLAIATAFYFDVIEDADGQSIAPFLAQAWAQAEQEPAIRSMLVRRRDQLVTTAQLLLREGVARGELAPWLDVEALAAACAALLDGILLQRIEEGPGYRRSVAERRARVVLEMALASAAVPDRPDLPAIAARPFPMHPAPTGGPAAPASGRESRRAP